MTGSTRNMIFHVGKTLGYNVVIANYFLNREIKVNVGIMKIGMSDIIIEESENFIYVYDNNLEIISTIAKNEYKTNISRAIILTTIIDKIVKIEVTGSRYTKTR